MSTSLPEPWAAAFKAMAENFDSYYSQLIFIKENSQGNTRIPYDDVCVLYRQYTEDPPKIKTDKLSFYLSMEKTLYCCEHPEYYEQEQRNS